MAHENVAVLNVVSALEEGEGRPDVTEVVRMLRAAELRRRSDSGVLREEGVRGEAVVNTDEAADLILGNRGGLDDFSDGRCEVLEGLPGVSPSTTMDPTSRICELAKLS